MKKLVIDQLVERVKKEIEQAEQAASTAKALNQGDDMKQEGKYDTRAIEAGYLAGAQQKRVEELKLELKLLEANQTRDFCDQDEISAGALLELELNGKKQKYFLSNTSGGSFITIGDETVMIISVFSPLGSELVGLKVGDSFEVESPKGNREYMIISLC